MLMYHATKRHFDYRGAVMARDLMYRTCILFDTRGLQKPVSHFALV